MSQVPTGRDSVELMLDNLDQAGPKMNSAKFWSAISATKLTNTPTQPTNQAADSMLLRRRRELIGKTVKGHLKVKGPATGRKYWLRWNSNKCDLVHISYKAVFTFFEGENIRNNARVQCVIRGINPDKGDGHCHPFCSEISAAKRTRKRKSVVPNGMPRLISASVTPYHTPLSTPEPRVAPTVCARFARFDTPSALKQVPIAPRNRPRRVTIGKNGPKQVPMVPFSKPKVSMVESKKATQVDLRKPSAGLLSTRPATMVFSQMLQRRKSGTFWQNFMFGNHQTGSKDLADRISLPTSGESSDAIETGIVA